MAKGGGITGPLREEQHTFVNTFVTNVTMVAFVTKVNSMWMVAAAALVACLPRLLTLPLILSCYHGYHCSLVALVACRRQKGGHFLSSFKEQYFVLEMVNRIGNVCRAKPFWCLDIAVAASEQW